MNYSEAAYFDGNHCAHVAAFHEWKRLERIRIMQVRERARREWDALPDYPRRIAEHAPHQARVRDEAKRIWGSDYQGDWQ